MSVSNKMKEQTFFGRISNGDIANRFVLENNNGMRIEVSDFGALVLSIILKDRNGVLRDVVLGFGHDSGTVPHHELEVYSDAYLNIDEELIPTGEVIDVTNTPMDFRQRKKIGKDIECDYLPLQYARGYDHNYVFENDRVLKKVAKLYAANSGIVMTVLSDLCGLQIYSGNFLNGEIGKGGAVYNKNSGMCLETQFYPNACNEKKFPSPLLKARKKFTSRTVYQFEVQ